MMAIKKSKWKSVGNMYRTVHFPASLNIIANVGMTLLLRK